MPHKTVRLMKDGIANRNGSLYASWVQGKIALDRLTTDGITCDVLHITGLTPIPSDTIAILAAMSQRESGLILLVKLFLFGHMCGVHNQRRKDREAERCRYPVIEQIPTHASCASETRLPPLTCIGDLQALADRLDVQYHEAEVKEQRIYREGAIGVNGYWRGDDVALAVARERMNLLRSVLGEFEPILYRIKDKEAGGNVETQYVVPLHGQPADDHWAAYHDHRDCGVGTVGNVRQWIERVNRARARAVAWIITKIKEM
jgi:hypothetical protein